MHGQSGRVADCVWVIQQHWVCLASASCAKIEWLRCLKQPDIDPWLGSGLLLQHYIELLPPSHPCPDQRARIHAVGFLLLLLPLLLLPCLTCRCTRGPGICSACWGGCCSGCCCCWSDNSSIDRHSCTGKVEVKGDGRWHLCLTAQPGPVHLPDAIRAKSHCTPHRPHSVSWNNGNISSQPNPIPLWQLTVGLANKPTPQAQVSPSHMC